MKRYFKAKNNNIQVLLIEGNHDNISGYDEINSWLGYLERKGYVRRGKYRASNEGYRIWKITIGDVNFYGVGYPGFAVDEVLEKLSENLNEMKNIVMVHTALGGQNFFLGW